MRELFTREELSLFAKAINSKLRVDLLQYIANHPGGCSMTLSNVFNVSRAAITQNIKILADAGIVDIGSGNGTEGRKGCFMTERWYLLDFQRQFHPQKVYSTEIPIGQYSVYSITPTCGVATSQEIIGQVDNPAFFDDPKRFDASILWFTTGYIEYRLPNYLKPDQKVTELQLSFEISSEALGSAENWPSDITFSLNGIELGSWTSPGDYGNIRGRYTPLWWELNWNQYGLLKLLIINELGTYIDGRMISHLKIDDLHIDNKSELKFRFAVHADALNPGGCTLFGKGFGNYNQAIRFKLIYENTQNQN